MCGYGVHSTDGRCLVFVEQPAARFSDLADAHVLRIRRALEFGVSALRGFGAAHRLGVGRRSRQFVLLAHGAERLLVPLLPWLRGWLGLGLALMLGFLALRGAGLRALGGSTSVFVLAALLIFALSAAHYVATGFNQDLVRHGVVHEVTSLVAPTVIVLTATALRHQDTVQANGGSEVALTTIAFSLTLLVLVAELTARLTRSVQKPWRWAWTSGAGCLAIAVFPWYSGSINAPSCSAGGWFNGHQWWHILVAVALYLQWRFFDHHATDRGLPKAL